MPSIQNKLCLRNRDSFLCLCHYGDTKAQSNAKRFMTRVGTLCPECLVYQASGVISYDSRSGPQAANPGGKGEAARRIQLQGLARWGTWPLYGSRYVADVMLHTTLAR